MTRFVGWCNHEAMTDANTLDGGKPSSPMESPTLHTARIVQRSGSSFHGAMRVLDPARRSAIYAIYAFCRVVDDIADGTGDTPFRRCELEGWRKEIRHIYQGTAHTPIGQALSDVVVRYSLAERDFLAVIDGMECDAVDRVRMPDEVALYEYIDRVACAVGRLCTPIFGLPAQQGIALAQALGEALQLTNILRDLEEDAARDRLYLPIDKLAALGINDDNALAVCAHPASAMLCQELAQRAQQRFNEVEEILSHIDVRTRRAPRLMMMAYRRLLDKIIWNGWGMPRRRATLSYGEKLWIMIRYGCL